MNLNAQIPKGTTAPGWIATDLDGNIWDMYDILNSGKHVVLEFSTTWCVFCWNFHNTSTLKTLHDTYGPNGTDQIRVFYIEADPNTNSACLYGSAGCNSSTYGDWVTGHDFPFIDISADNAPAMPSDYQVPGYPTIYAISANGNNGVYVVGQQTDINVWASWFFESFEMEMTGTVIDAICAGDGAIQLTVVGGAGSINYEWSTGAWGQDYISGLDAGTYSVTVTDENGFEISETFEVDGTMEGPVTVELLASSEVLCNGDNTGALSIGASGGNGGYSFLWDNGFKGTYFDGLTAGIYSVQITDSEGCTGNRTFMITEPDLLTLTSLPEDANCEDEDGAVVAFSTGGIIPWKYDYGEGPNYTGIFNNVSPGDYIMSVIDGNECIEMVAFTINSTDLPEVAAEVDGELDCSIQEITVSGFGSSEGDEIEYEWSTEDGNIVEGANDIDAVVDAAGSYTLMVTNTETGCSETMDVAVEANVETPFNMILVPETLTCTTIATILDASGSSEGDNFTYSWSSDGGNITSGANTNMVEVDAAGEYTLLVTNSENGCTTEQTVTVELDDALPSVSVEDKVINCTTTEVELCADVDENTVVTWMTDTGEVETNCITVSMAGTYMVTAKGTNGCENTADAVVTLSADLPQVSIEQPETITCTVTSVVIDASLEGNAENFDIKWMDESGVIINNADLSIDVSQGGVYTLSVMNTANGCTTVSSVSVDEVIINPESAFTTNLNEGILELTNNSNGDPSSFIWNFGSSDENTTTTFDETGTYEVCLTVSNDCGEDTYCEDVYFVSQLVYEYEKLDVACYGEAIGSISVTPSGGEPEYSISWVGPNGFTANDLEITGLVVGKYSMVLTDNYGNEKTDNYVLTQPSEISQSFVQVTDETNSDANGSISIDVSGGTGNLTYEWNNGLSTAIIEGLSAGEYTLDVTDENDCVKTFGPFTISSNTVGVIDLDFVADMQIYPVPAVNFLNVTIDLTNAEATQLRILDAYGKIISTDNYNSKMIKTQIDVSNLSTGIYYLEFGNKSGRTLEKFIVVH